VERNQTEVVSRELALAVGRARGEHSGPARAWCHGAGARLCDRSRPSSCSSLSDSPFRHPRRAERVGPAAHASRSFTSCAAQRSGP